MSDAVLGCHSVYPLAHTSQTLKAKKIVITITTHLVVRTSGLLLFHFVQVTLVAATYKKCCIFDGNDLKLLFAYINALHFYCFQKRH